MKIKYILHWFCTKSGDSFFRLTNTENGKSFEATNVPESNARFAIYHLNGNQHVQNCYYAESLLTARQFKYQSEDAKYHGTGSKELAEAAAAVIN